MKLPLVLVTDRTKMGRELEAEFPGRIGFLFSPAAFKNPAGLPYALDNGRFTVWKNNKKWDEDGFHSLLERTKVAARPPLWAVVPDVVADAEGTFKEWKVWHPRMRKEYDFPFALAVQDGMRVKDVIRLRPSPDVIFVGGTMGWKWKTAREWCQNFPRVHVARVCYGRKLWMVQRAGAESSDGTAWWRPEHNASLRRYLSRSSAGKGEFDHKGFLH